MQIAIRKVQWLITAIVALSLLFITTAGFAANDYYHYDRQDTNDNHDKVTINVQASGSSSWSTALCYLPETTSTTLRGRLLAATGTNIYLQDAVDSNSWTVVGTTTDTMDPSFIRVSPDGTQVALGQGYLKPLLIFPLSILDSSTPPNVVGSSTSFPWGTKVQYYDAQWVDNHYLLIIGAAWDKDKKEVSNSGISTLDTRSAGNSINTILFDSVAYASSSGIAIDDSKNIIYGNGYSYTTSSLQGELRMLPASVWWNGSSGQPKIIGNPGGYFHPDSRKFANQVLSAAHLGFDEEGNLHVGGGKYYQPQQGETNEENGYAVLINKQVISDTADITVPLYQVDESDATQYRKIVADNCQNDTATGILSYKRSISVHWLDNLDCGGTPTPGSSTDSWSFNTASKLTTYRIDTSRDGDGDSFPDVDDHSPWTSCANNTDTDADGYGNYIDADLDNDGDVDSADNLIFDDAYGNTTNLNADFDGDGDVDSADNLIFDDLYGKTAPFYNTTF